jgi:hypothetical protein
MFVGTGPLIEFLFSISFQTIVFYCFVLPSTESSPRCLHWIAIISCNSCSCKFCPLMVGAASHAKLRNGPGPAAVAWCQLVRRWVSSLTKPFCLSGGESRREAEGCSGPSGGSPWAPRPPLAESLPKNTSHAIIYESHTNEIGQLDNQYIHKTKCVPFLFLSFNFRAMAKAADKRTTMVVGYSSA